MNSKRRHAPSIPTVTTVTTALRSVIKSAENSAYGQSYDQCGWTPRSRRDGTTSSVVREGEKARIVSESMAGPRLVAPTARRYNISRSMLVTWRRAFKAARCERLTLPPFVPAVVAEPTPTQARATTTDDVPRAARIEIVLPCNRRVIVDESVDPAALARVLDVLDHR